MPSYTATAISITHSCSFFLITNLEFIVVHKSWIEKINALSKNILYRYEVIGKFNLRRTFKLITNSIAFLIKRSLGNKETSLETNTNTYFWNVGTKIHLLRKYFLQICVDCIMDECVRAWVYNNRDNRPQ